MSPRTDVVPSGPAPAARSTGRAAGRRHRALCLLSGLVLGFLGSVIGQSALADPGGRLIATGGAMTVDGAAGGGIVPWATLAGYAERNEIGGAIALTGVSLPDFDLRARSAAVSFGNRLELSFAQQRFDAGSVVPGTTLEQDVFGAKVRLAGDLVYGRLPQLSVGAMLKRNTAFDVPEAVGAEDDTGFDVYAAATRLWLAGPFGRSAFVNLNVRATRANQLGLMGFGGDRRDAHSIVGEAAAGLFLNRHWALGAEYRQKPDNLSFAREDDWFDVFVGWFPTKRVAVVAAWSDLGSIAGKDDQRSAYLSLQLSH